MNSTNKEIEKPQMKNEKTVYEAIEKPQMKNLKESKNQEIDKSQIKKLKNHKWKIWITKKMKIQINR